MWYRALSLLLWVCSSIAQPVSTPVLTIEEAVRLAVVNHPSLQALRMDQTLTQNEVAYQSAEFLPKLTLEMMSGIKEENNELPQHAKLFKAFPSIQLKTPIGTQFKMYAEDSTHREQGYKHHDQSVTLMLKQPLLKGVSPKINRWPLEGAKLQYQIDRLTHQHALENVIDGVLSAYARYQQTIWQVEIQQHYLDQSERFFEEITEKFNVGRVRAQDLIAPELQIKKAKQSLLIAKQEVKHWRRLIFDAIGIEDTYQPIYPQLQSSTNAALHEIKITQEDVFAHDLDLHRIEVERQRLMRELIITKDSQRFDLNIQADVHLGQSHHHFLEQIYDDRYYHLLPKHNKGYSAAVYLTIPFGDKQRHHYEKLAKYTLIEKNKLQQKQLEQALIQQYHEMVEEIEMQQERYALVEQELALSVLEYDAVLEQYWLGRASIFEVIRSKEQHLAAQISLAQAKLNAIELKTKVQKLTGTLLEQWHVSVH